MTSDSLAKLYAEVVKVRPEGAIDWHHNPDENSDDWEWSCGGEPRSYEEAHDRIVWKWLGMMPPNTALLPMLDGRWRLVRIVEDKWEGVVGTKAPTPIEALASYLKSTGEESK